MNLKNCIKIIKKELNFLERIQSYFLDFIPRPVWGGADLRVR